MILAATRQRTATRGQSSREYFRRAETARAHNRSYEARAQWTDIELERIDCSRINNFPRGGAKGRNRLNIGRKLIVELVCGLFNPKLLAFASDKSGEPLRDARDADAGMIRNVLS